MDYGHGVVAEQEWHYSPADAKVRNNEWAAQVQTANGPLIPFCGELKYPSLEQAREMMAERLKNAPAVPMPTPARKKFGGRKFRRRRRCPSQRSRKP